MKRIFRFNDLRYYIKIITFFYLAFFMFTCIRVDTCNSMDTEDMGPMNKFERGITNTATAWYEIPKTMKEDCKRLGPVGGLFYGFFHGIGKSITKTILGLFEATTFYQPPYEPLEESDKVK